MFLEPFVHVETEVLLAPQHPGQRLSHDEGSIFTDVTRGTPIRAFTTQSAGYVVEKADIDFGWTRPLPEEAFAYGYQAEMRHFVECVREDKQPMPYEKLERKEAAGFLSRIVATLPPRQQEVIQLKFQNDLSYQQIAEITKTTANNVGVLIHTALKTLRQRYGEVSKDFISFNPRTT